MDKRPTSVVCASHDLEAGASIQRLVCHSFLRSLVLPQNRFALGLNICPGGTHFQSEGKAILWQNERSNSAYLSAITHGVGDVLDLHTALDGKACAICDRTLFA